MPRIVVLADRYGERSETFVAAEAEALRRAGHEVRIESVAHPDDPVARPDAVWLDETTAQRAVALLRLVARHPLACLADRRDRRRWREVEAVPNLRMLAPFAGRLREGDHVHVHFAAGAALAALRVARITGTPFSVTAHAWDIYQRPANLREKLEAAAFATSGCDYTVGHLRELAPLADVHRVVMGVDGSRFAPDGPPPGERVVLAVGRLVEKKGFRHLAAAATRLRELGRPARVLIAGEGPERARLAGEPDVELLGAVGHDRVRELLAGADVVCVPCVVARDGDRDSMPVVAKEALAMGVPVVATREVGLPELIEDGWGRLVPPRDPAALARALEELLALPAAERQAMGRAGREHVLAMADVDTEARRLAALIDASRGARRGGRPSPGSTAS